MEYDDILIKYKYNYNYNRVILKLLLLDQLISSFYNNFFYLFMCHTYKSLLNFNI